MVGGHKLQVKLPTPKMTAGPAQQLNPFQKAQMIQQTQQMQYAQQAVTSQGWVELFFRLFSCRQ